MQLKHFTVQPNIPLQIITLSSQFRLQRYIDTELIRKQKYELLGQLNTIQIQNTTVISIVKKVLRIKYANFMISNKDLQMNTECKQSKCDAMRLTWPRMESPIRFMFSTLRMFISCMTQEGRAPSDAMFWKRILSSSQKGKQSRVTD